MYAVIQTGGKQYRVEEGQRLDVERLGEADEVTLTPVLVVDGDTVLATPAQLAGASVSARVVGAAKGRRWGHRQHYATIEITGIKKG